MVKGGGGDGHGGEGEVDEKGKCACERLPTWERGLHIVC